MERKGHLGVSDYSRFITHPGDLRRKGSTTPRLTVRSLLEQLGVSHAPKEEQRQAIASWLETNNPDRVLIAGLERRALLPHGADDLAARRH